MSQCIKSKQALVFVVLIGKGYLVILDLTQESQISLLSLKVKLLRKLICDNFSSPACPSLLCHKFHIDHLCTYPLQSTSSNASPASQRIQEKRLLHTLSHL
ncbi:hypothetical protein Hanom_Chr04g00374241 [Helianthus anomalus]